MDAVRRGCLDRAKPCRDADRIPVRCIRNPCFGLQASRSGRPRGVYRGGGRVRFGLRVHLFRAARGRTGSAHHHLYRLWQDLLRRYRKPRLCPRKGIQQFAAGSVQGLEKMALAATSRHAYERQDARDHPDMYGPRDRRPGPHASGKSATACGHPAARRHGRLCPGQSRTPRPGPQAHRFLSRCRSRDRFSGAPGRFGAGGALHKRTGSGAPPGSRRPGCRLGSVAVRRVFQSFDT